MASEHRVSAVIVAAKDAYKHNINIKHIVNKELITWRVFFLQLTIVIMKGMVTLCVYCFPGCTWRPISSNNVKRVSESWYFGFLFELYRVLYPRSLESSLMNGKQREERKEEKKFAGGTKTFMSEFNLSTLSSGLPRFIIFNLAIALLFVKYIIQ
jgi:hypothetical protein